MSHISAPIILQFFLAELALYALDVYYNQTYLNRIDNKQDNYGYNQLNQQAYPQYYDYYQQTFRSAHQDSWWQNLVKVPQWIALAYEM